jgi:phosphatidylglycerophosphate synthase
MIAANEVNGMLDGTSRRLLAAPLAFVAARLDRRWITPDRITLAGLALGVCGAIAAARAAWILALVLWLARCLADGLDGPLARRRKAAGGGTSEAGGFLDICCDFIAYGSFVVGVGIGHDRSLVPFLFVLLAYYANGSIFLAFSSIAERTGRQLEDGRSLSFLGGLAEGTETVLVHSLWCLVPAYAGGIAWAWAAVVGVSSLVRLLQGYRALR